MSAKGWLLSLNGGPYAAVGARELIYVLPEHPEIHSVPLAPPWAPGVIIWEKRLVPVIDAGMLLQRAPVTSVTPHGFAVVVAFTTADITADGAIGLGALLLRQVPVAIDVSDTQACELPDGLAAHRFFNSCFAQADYGAVPILNLQALFCP